MPVVPPPPRPPRASWGQHATLRWLRRYFGFSPAENRGVVVLLLVGVAVAILPIVLRPADPVYLPAADQRQLDQWANSLKGRLDSSQLAERAAYAARYPERTRRAAGPRYAAVPQVRLAPFDPNALTAEGWEARGVPHFVAGRIFNYGQKAGGFKAKAQIKRVYGLDSSVYQRLELFIQLPEELPKRERPAYTNGAGLNKDGTPGRLARKPAHLQPFDLNQADTTQLMLIKGIGRGRAKGIVKHRNELGGFINESQLSEFFMLRDAPDLVDSLRKYTFVAPGFLPRPVNINSATFDDLWPHPYVGKQLARMIIAFRAQHGPYKTPEDLRQLKTLKEEKFLRLQPYLRCE